MTRPMNLSKCPNILIGVYLSINKLLNLFVSSKQNKEKQAFMQLRENSQKQLELRRI